MRHLAAPGLHIVLYRVVFFLLQLPVFGLGLLIDGNVGVSIFPKGEEVFTRGARPDSHLLCGCAAGALGVIGFNPNCLAMSLTLECMGCKVRK